MVLTEMVINMSQKIINLKESLKVKTKKNKKNKNKQVP